MDAGDRHIGEAFPIAVLISGSGSTLLNILERSNDGSLPVRVAGVIASKRCSGLDHATNFDIPQAIVKRGKPFDADDFSARITAQLASWQPQLIVFGGFLSMYLPPKQYAGRVVNIHPALLPAFGGKGMYGDRVHEAVLASGAKVTGCSVHLVDAEYDTGPIIAQRILPVLEDDTPETLGARVRETERELYPEVIGWFAAGRVRVDNGKVHIADRDLNSL